MQSHIICYGVVVVVGMDMGRDREGVGSDKEWVGEGYDEIRNRQGGDRELIKWDKEWVGMGYGRDRR